MSPEPRFSGLHFSTPLHSWHALTSCFSVWEAKKQEKFFLTSRTIELKNKYLRVGGQGAVVCLLHRLALQHI
jgi:hypothetical protein